MADSLTDRRQTPFAWFGKEIIDTYASKMGPSAMAVYMALVYYADREHRCFPSYRTIAEKLNIGRSTVIEAITKLVELGLVSVEHRKNENGEPTSNLYTILDAPTHSARLTPKRSGSPESGSGSPESGHEQEVINKKEFNKKDATDAKRPSRGRTSKPKDERLNHPVIVAYRDVCRVTPNEVQRGEMIEAVADVDAWRTVLVEWMGRGWRPGNVTGQIEKYLQAHPKPQPAQKYTYVEQPDGSMKKILVAE